MGTTKIPLLQKNEASIYTDGKIHDDFIIDIFVARFIFNTTPIFTFYHVVAISWHDRDQRERSECVLFG